MTIHFHDLLRNKQKTSLNSNEHSEDFFMFYSSITEKQSISDGYIYWWKYGHKIKSFIRELDKRSKVI